MNTMDCARVQAEEVAEAYLVGRLTDAEREAYETHYFECDRCFEELRTLQTVQGELRRGEGARLKPFSSARSRGARASAGLRRLAPWALAASVALAVAAGLGTWRSTRSTGADRSLPSTPAAAGAQAGASASRLAELGRIEPPAYIPFTARSADDWRVRFDSAMETYAARRYDEAAARLEMVVSQRPAVANARFFLGVTYLMLDRTDDAIRALRQTIETADPAYADDARFFLAKARLRKGDRSAAVEILDGLTASNGPRSAEAGQLLAAIRAIR